MTFKPSYICRWFAKNSYLSVICDTLAHKWSTFLKSNLFKEVSKPETLKLFAISAALGVIASVIVMIGWRLFGRRRDAPNDYAQSVAQSDADVFGTFNTKMIESINKKHQPKAKSGFDQVVPTNDESDQKPTQSQNPQTCQSSSSISDCDDDELESESPSGELNSTRITSNFKLSESEVEKLSHMKFHGKLRSASLRARADKLEGSLSAEEREKEQKLKAEQLENIFKMMQNEGSKFGINNKEELMDQFKFYGS